MSAVATAEQQLKEAGRSCLAILLVPPSVLWGAFVNWKVYGWLAPSVGLPTLSLGTIGLIGVLVGLLRWQPSTKKHDPARDQTPLASTCYVAAARGFALVTAWAFHTWGAA